MDIEQLLKPISPELPCGPDADNYEQEKGLYDDFSQLKSRLEGEMKNGVLQPPKWSTIQESALALAARTKHLHLGIILVECGLVNEGLAGFRDGLRLLHEWCANFWPQLYPRDVRHALIDSLASPRFLLKPRRLMIAKAAGGSFCFEDYLKAEEDKDEADSEIANHARLVLGVFRATPRERLLENITLIEEALNHARGIEDIFDERGDPDDAVNLANLRSLLASMLEALRPLSEEVPAAEEAAGAPPETAKGSFPAPGLSFGGSVGNREQAAEQLEQIARFFEKTEPSSPLPYLLRRARRCIGKRFMDLIDELATTKEHATQVLSPDIAPEDSSNQ